MLGTAHTCLAVDYISCITRESCVNCVHATMRDNNKKYHTKRNATCLYWQRSFFRTIFATYVGRRGVWGVCGAFVHIILDVKSYDTRVAFFTKVRSRSTLTCSLRQISKSPLLDAPCPSPTTQWWNWSKRSTLSMAVQKIISRSLMDAFQQFSKENPFYDVVLTSHHNYYGPRMANRQL